MRHGTAIDKSDGRFAVLFSEAGNPPCDPPDDCEVCLLFGGQRPDETRADWLSRITGGFALPAECRNGHPRTPENSYRNGQGTSICRPCRQATVAAYRQRHSA